MANGSMKSLPDLEEEMHLLQAKLMANDQAKLKLIEVEVQLRIDIQRVEKQISRLKKAQEKTPQQ